LQALGIDPTRQYTQADWDAFNQKLSGRLYSIREALYAFTGSYPSYNDINAANASALRTALVNGQYVIAQSPASGTISSDGIIRNHAYAVLAVYQDAGAWKVRLYNPWGSDEGNGKTLDALGPSAPADDGIITLSWSQFTNNANFKAF